MKLYPVPGGIWAGTEAEWKAAMKEAGLDHKIATRKSIEIPTDKKGLMEFLTFYAVDVISPRGEGVNVAPVQAPVAPPVDVEALRALHNPDGVRPSALTTVSPSQQQAVSPINDLETSFDAASISTQLRLAVKAIDNADARISRG